MTINVETDHPHGVAHVALFTCQHQPQPTSTSFTVGPPPAYRSNPTEYELIPDRRYRSPMATTPAPVTPPIKSTRILVGTLASALVMFGIVLFTVLPSGDYPPIWVPWALGGLALLSHLLSRTVGFNLRPVPAGTLPTEAMATALAAFQASLILRFALSEAVAILALVLSFVVPPQTWMTYLTGGVLALILLAVNVWPSTAVVSKVQRRLDREGGQSFLGDALLGLAPGTAASAVIRT